MSDDTCLWVPFELLDLTTASNDAFESAVSRVFAQSRKLAAEDALPPFPFKNDGWYDISPEMSEAALFHTRGNRPVSLTTVRTYAEDMGAGDWQATGETITAATGKLDNGHHRLLAGYFGQHTFRCYVVTSVAEDIPNLFAYFDSGKKRNAADALYITGWNGSGRIVAEVIQQLALRYDMGLLGVTKQPRFKPVNSRRVLAYVKDHPDLRQAAQLMLGTYAEASEVIQSKAAAVMFGWLVLKAYGVAVLGDFCEPLGSGALLGEDSPILAVRNRLLMPELPGTPKMLPRTRLAYACKAFLMHVAGEKMERGRGYRGQPGRVEPLTLGLDDPFPRITAPVMLAAN